MYGVVPTLYAIMYIFIRIETPNENFYDHSVRLCLFMHAYISTERKAAIISNLSVENLFQFLFLFLFFFRYEEKNVEKEWQKVMTSSSNRIIQFGKEKKNTRERH